jgi:hypothetical protein
MDEGVERLANNQAGTQAGCVWRRARRDSVVLVRRRRSDVMESKPVDRPLLHVTCYSIVICQLGRRGPGCGGTITESLTSRSCASESVLLAFGLHLLSGLPTTCV